MRVAVAALALLLTGAGDSAPPLVILHGPEKQLIYVNARLVTSIRQPRPGNRDHFARGINCIVVMANGNFIAVTDACEDVRRKLSE